MSKRSRGAFGGVCNCCRSTITIEEAHYRKRGTVPYCEKCYKRLFPVCMGCEKKMNAQKERIIIWETTTGRRILCSDCALIDQTKSSRYCLHCGVPDYLACGGISREGYCHFCAHKLGGMICNCCGEPFLRAGRLVSSKSLARMYGKSGLRSVTMCNRCAEFYHIANCSCGKPYYPVDNPWEDQGLHACPACASHYRTCQCGNITSIGSLDAHNGLCPTCWDRLYFYCTWCGESHLRTEAIELENGTTYCQRCAATRSFVCAICNERIVNSVNHFAERVVAEDIAPRQYCYKCGIERGLDFSLLISGTLGKIHGHDFKPAPIFFGLGKKTERGAYCFGFELEVEFMRSSREADISDVAHEFAIKTFGSLPSYLKYDGSLSHGFEIVSHPLTWSWWMKNKNKVFEALEWLRSNGLESYNPGTCGIHVHINKASIGSLHLWRMLRFLYAPNNFPFLKTISQRGNKCGGCSWGAARESYGGYEMKDAAKYKNSDRSRYTTLNLQPKATAEIRIFRGTLQPKSFAKNIEFSRAVWEYTRDEKSTAALLGYQPFLVWVSAQNNHEFGALKSFLIDKELLTGRRPGERKEATLCA